jgi:cation diffusion facilitator CzcD-associated flavoprotein CzcO
MSAATPERVEVLVIGAGISGVGAAIRLLREGITDFVVLEKAAALGGTWRDNVYPGCACDVPSALYSYSFAQKPDWSQAFAGQREILDYVRDTAVQFGVIPYLRFGEGVEDALWNEASQRWIVKTSSRVYHARAVISCAGYLHEPSIPALPGLAEFKGTIFHSSRWRRDHDLMGQRVAVIGTGASAIQFVPEIQPRVARLHVFQRTPQWILPKPDHTLTDLEKSVFQRPPALHAWRAALYGALETFGVGFRRPRMLAAVQRLALRHLRRSVADPALRRALTPDYVLGCKRVLLSNDYYPAMAAPNVELLPTGVRALRGDVVIGHDGSEREVDTIVLGTGFHVSDPPIAQRIRGNDGRSLADLWSGSPRAYRGTTIAGFPNLFFVLGPNLAIGHNSAFIVIEAQLDYVMSALTTMRRLGLGRFEVRSGVQEAYNAEVQRDLQGTVWNTGGCSSYYLDANGRNSIGFPWSTVTMRKLLREVDTESYNTEAIKPNS